MKFPTSLLCYGLQHGKDFRNKDAIPYLYRILSAF
jgi:hypothetical protein